MKIDLTKIFLGTLSLLFAIQTSSYAEDFQLPHQFNSGDVLSASVLNEAFDKIKESKRSLTENDLLGVWQCDAILGNNWTLPNNSIASEWQKDSSQLLIVLEDAEVTFSQNQDQTYSISTSEPSPFNILDATPIDSHYVVRADMIFFNPNSGGIKSYEVRRVSESRVVLYFPPTDNVSPTLICDKQELPPNSSTGLSATLSNANVTLSWEDNSDDESGFKILRKNDLTSEFEEIDSVTSGITTYTDTLSEKGTYWYRIVATNDNGDSDGSNVVKVTKE